MTDLISTDLAFDQHVAPFVFTGVNYLVTGHLNLPAVAGHAGRSGGSPRSTRSRSPSPDGSRRPLIENRRTHTPFIGQSRAGRAAHREEVIRLTRALEVAHGENLALRRNDGSPST